MSDNLREALLDAMLDGTAGKGLIITRQELIEGFPEYSERYTGCFLSNSEMETAAHSPTYSKFTCRVGEGAYRVHPQALAARLESRQLQQAPKPNERSPSMNKLNWDETLVSELDLIFLRTVRDNMRQEGSMVRFGITGQGTKPNYQITFATGRVHTRSGLSHEHHSSAEEFDPKNLSEQAFSYSQITAIYQARRPR